MVDHVHRSGRHDRRVRRAARRRADRAHRDVDLALQPVRDRPGAWQSCLRSSSSGRSPTPPATRSHVLQGRPGGDRRAGRTRYEVAASADRACRHGRDGRLRALPADVHLSLSARRALVRTPRIGAALARPACSTPRVIVDVLRAQAAAVARGDLRVRLAADPAAGCCLQRPRDVRLRDRRSSRRFLPRCSTLNVGRTAIDLSGVINGIGTIAFTLFVDPTSSMITDQAIHGKRTVEEVRSMVFYLSLTAIVGSLALAADLLSRPPSLIEFVARFANHVTFLIRRLIGTRRSAAYAALVHRVCRVDRALDRRYARASGRRRARRAATCATRSCRTGSRCKSIRRTCARSAGYVLAAAGLAQAEYTKGSFDDALATIREGLAVDPESVRLDALKTDDRKRQAQARDRDLELPDLSRSRVRNRAGLRTTRRDEQAAAQSLKRFNYTFDSDDLTDAIKRSYELQLDLAKNTNRLIAYRQLVTSGVPQAPSEATGGTTTSLLPLP